MRAFNVSAGSVSAGVEKLSKEKERENEVELTSWLCLQDPSRRVLIDANAWK